MDLVHKLMNIIVPPIGLTMLLFFLSTYLFFKLLISTIKSIFSEDVAGKHLAYEYARRGACLALITRRENRLREVASTTYQLGSPEVIVIPANVSKVEDCKRFVDEIVEHFGHFLTALRLTSTQVSKTAVQSFFETLRVELGEDIGIKIVNLGLIESEMTQGKFLSKEGRMVLDQEMRDILVSIMPIEPVGKCAKTIMKGACRREKHLIEPAWMRVTYFWKVFYPKILEYWLLLPRPGLDLERDTPTKRLLHLTGLKKYIYSESVQFPELKATG
ncbi:hypothetical protein I3842_11G004700 [Carya illinoinensis]|uniref:Uncharacterized protein n=1 Tax=Carya illinoinensis TaxID=32201 RepID=A0A922DKI2_CARIL|nr:hypothetical protein I3842_11G004700 [Carya illinoinensis]